jgi:WhiB family transcriptional regulator, redox-sensing transcriptional regulator
VSISPALDLTNDRGLWREQAACRDTDPDLFFPVGTTGPAIEQIRSAKAVCAECEVRTPCLEYAIESNQDSGVWGGLSEDERRALRRQRVAARRKAG